MLVLLASPSGEDQGHAAGRPFFFKFKGKEIQYFGRTLITSLGQQVVA